MTTKFPWKKRQTGDLHQTEVQRLVFIHVMLLLKSFSVFSIHYSGKLRTLQQTGSVRHFPGLAMSVTLKLIILYFLLNLTMVSSVREGCVSKGGTETSFFTHHLHTQPPKELIFMQGSLKHSPKDCSQWNKQTNKKQIGIKQTLRIALRVDLLSDKTRLYQWLYLRFALSRWKGVPL